MRKGRIKWKHRFNSGYRIQCTGCAMQKNMKSTKKKMRKRNREQNHVNKKQKMYKEMEKVEGWYWGKLWSDKLRKSWKNSVVKVSVFFSSLFLLLLLLYLLFCVKEMLERWKGRWKIYIECCRCHCLRALHQTMFFAFT